MASSDVVLIVHGGCADGRTSAGLLRRKYPEADVVGVQPASLLEALRDVGSRPRLERVVIADLSPQSRELEAILAQIRDLRSRAPVTWLDHHAPQWSTEFEAAVRTAGVEVVVDRSQTESGASLAAKWTGESDPDLLRVADLIRKRDAWVDPHDPQARAWTLVASEVEDYEDRLARRDLAGLEELGAQLLAQKEERIRRTLTQVRHHTPAVAYLWGEDDVSDVADRLFQQDARVVFLLRFGRSGRVSLRSRPDRPVASVLAQEMGGGGHANAAGYSFRLGFWRRLWFRMRRVRDPLVLDSLRRAARIAG